jgi:hypothetical protein
MHPYRSLRRGLLALERLRRVARHLLARYKAEEATTKTAMA